MSDNRIYYKVMCKSGIRRGEPIREYNSVEYDNRRDAEAVRLCAQDEGLEAWVETHADTDFIYVDTDSVKTEGPYRGGFTHTDSVKEDPNGT